MGDTYVVELFSFPNPPARPSYPEAAGLRHLAFEVNTLASAVSELDSKGVKHEPIRTGIYGQMVARDGDARAEILNTLAKTSLLGIARLTTKLYLYIVTNR